MAYIVRAERAARAPMTARAGVILRKYQNRPPVTGNWANLGVVITGNYQNQLLQVKRIAAATRQQQRGAY